MLLTRHNESPYASRIVHYIVFHCRYKFMLMFISCCTHMSVKRPKNVPNYRLMEFAFCQLSSLL